MIFFIPYNISEFFFGLKFCLEILSFQSLLFLAKFCRFSMIAMLCFVKKEFNAHFESRSTLKFQHLKVQFIWLWMFFFLLLSFWKWYAMLFLGEHSKKKFRAHFKKKTIPLVFTILKGLNETRIIIPCNHTYTHKKNQHNAQMHKTKLHLWYGNVCTCEMILIADENALSNFMPMYGSCGAIAIQTTHRMSRSG